METVAEFLNDDGEYYSDRFLVEASVLKGMPERSNYSRFEQNAGLEPLDEKQVPIERIYEKTDAASTGIVPTGRSLWQQVYSLLPKNYFIGEDFPARLAKEVGSDELPHPEILLQELGEYIEFIGHDMSSFQKSIRDLQKKGYHEVVKREMLSELHLRHGLTYVLARHIMGYLPRTSSWVDKISSLDPFTASAFALLVLARGTSQELPWISAIHDQAGIFQPLTSISQTIPRLEGAPLSRDRRPYKQVLQTLVTTTCVLNQDMLAVCRRLANIEPIPKIPSSLVKEALDVSERTARYKARLIERGIREHFIPNTSTLDWNYRCLLTKSRYAAPHPRNIVEKRILMDSEYVSFETHIEPRGIHEPEFRKGVGFHMAIENESVSFRLDLFDPDQREWRIEPWKDKVKETPYKHDGWLYVDTKSSEKVTPLTPTMQELIMLLLANEGSPQDKFTIMDLLGHSKSTDRQYLALLMEQGVLKLLYYPQPAFCLLPDELVVIIKDAGKEEIDRISRWLNSTMPLVHARFGDSGRNAIFQIRLPLHNVAIVKEIIDSKIDHLDSIIEVVSERKKYFLSIFRKGFNTEKERWSNPWK